VQRSSHFGDWEPHDWHVKCVFAFAISFRPLLAPSQAHQCGPTFRMTEQPKNDIGAAGFDGRKTQRFG
jgi:hypothetical protein